mgnify:CR=1 FL=1
MNSDQVKSHPFLQRAHLLLGVSRREVERRVSLGQIDPEILMAQLEQSSRELQMGVACERRIETESLTQVEQFADRE